MARNRSASVRRWSRVYPEEFHVGTVSLSVPACDIGAAGRCKYLTICLRIFARLFRPWRTRRPGSSWTAARVGVVHTQEVIVPVEHYLGTDAVSENCSRLFELLDGGLLGDIDEQEGEPSGNPLSSTPTRFWKRTGSPVEATLTRVSIQYGSTLGTSSRAVRPFACAGGKPSIGRTPHPAPGAGNRTGGPARPEGSRPRRRPRTWLRTCADSAGRGRGFR